MCRGLSGSWRQSTERASLCFYRSTTPGWCLKQRIPYVPVIIPWSLREGSAMGGSFLWEIQKIEGDFIEAARRACEAGYDGVELHGCHNYLLCQFFNRRVNRRTDLYNAEDMQIAKNIIDGIRKVTPPEFVVGIRLGAFEPEISDGVAHAKKLDTMGIDFINVSYGFDKEAVREKPQGYPFAEAIYGAERIRAAVQVPVFAVYGIQDGETAEAVLKQTGADMVNIGRGVLVNYNWASDVKAGRDPGKCLYCKTCMWRSDPDQCAGKLLFNRKR